MPGRVHHINRVVTTIAVQVLRPRRVRRSRVRVLRDKPSRRWVVVPSAHVLESAPKVPNTSGERHLIYEARFPAVCRVPVLVVLVALYQVSVVPHYVCYAPAYVIVVEVVPVRVFLLRRSVRVAEPLAPDYPSVQPQDVLRYKRPVKRSCTTRQGKDNLALPCCC